MIRFNIILGFYELVGNNSLAVNDWNDGNENNYYFHKTTEVGEKLNEII